MAKREERGCSYSRRDSDFFSHGSRCAAWLYLPEGVDRPPVVVMAHGFAAERSFRLPSYADRFARRGMAVLLFDYRNFGDSEGEPRNLVLPKRHLQDWKAAISHVRGLREVNGERVGLWGSSFSGGHVLCVAVQDPSIAAVVSQVPFVDGLASLSTLGMPYILRSLVAGFRDLARMVTLRSPYLVPVVEEPGRFGVMNTPEAKPGYLSIVPEGSSWTNACPARVFLAAGFYRPISRVQRIRCPVLIVYAERDSLIPVEAVERTVAKIARVEYMRLPVGHFDVYLGQPFEETVEREADFLETHLVGKGSSR